MKRPAEDRVPLWDDPNQLTIPRLRHTLSVYKISIDQGAPRTKLFQQYVRLARIQSPDSVKFWIGEHSLTGPLPAPDALVVSQIKIFLALHKIDYPAQAKRGHLVHLYQSITPAAPPRRSLIPSSPATSVTVSVVIPPHPEHKKRKANLRQKSKSSPPKPLPKSNALWLVPSHIGKPGIEKLPSHGRSKRIKSAARSETFFAPYSRREHAEDEQPSSARPRKVSSTSRRSSTTGASDPGSLSHNSESSQHYTLRRSPRLRAAHEDSRMLAELPSHELSPSSVEPTQSSRNEAHDNESRQYGSDDYSDMPTRRGDVAETSTRASSPTPSVSLADSPIHPVPSRESSQDRHSPTEEEASESPFEAPLTPQQPTQDGPDSPFEAPGSLISPFGRSSVQSSQRSTQEEGPESPFEAASTSRFFEEGAQPPTADLSRRASEEVESSRVQRSSSPVGLGNEAEDNDFQSSEWSSRLADQESEVSTRPSVQAGDPEASSTSPSANHSSESEDHDSEDHDSESSQQSSRPEVSRRRVTHEMTASSRPQPLSGASKKRKSEDPSEWPDASILTRVQLEEYLAAHDVPYDRSTRLARIIGSYNLLRSSLPHLGDLQPFKRPRASQSSPPPSSTGIKRRRTRARVEASSDDDQVGFVYSRPERSRNASIPPQSPSGSGSSDYQPSVAPTETSVGTPSRASISTRSTIRTTRSFPTENPRQKRAKKGNNRPQTSKKAGKRRARASRPKRTRWRVSTHHEADLASDTVNFVPVLPETSKKRKNRSSTPARAKRACPGPDDLPSSEFATHRQASASRRRQPEQTRHNTYTPHPSFRDDGQVDLEDVTPGHTEQSEQSDRLGRPSKRSPPAESSSRSVHTKRTRPNPPDFDWPDLELQQSRPPLRPSTSRREGRVRSDSYAPASSFHDDPSASSFHDGGPTQPHLDHPQETHPLATPRSKRRRPDDSSPSPQRAKRQAPSAACLIPSSAHVRRRRAREQRVRLNSLTIPSIHDDFIVPNPSESGVERWRNSVPPGLSPPSRSPSPPPSANPNLRRCALGECTGMLSELTQAAGRLTDSIVHATNQASLMQSTRLMPINGQAQIPASSSAPTHQDPIRQDNGVEYLSTPATAAEKAVWVRDPANDYPEDEPMSASSASSHDDAVDPCFPYPNGPGHREASASTLKIMWRSMQRCRVVSFRPDFVRAVRDTDNLFLWDLAHSIFIKLVRAQEYPEIDLETCSSAKIYDAILNHAKQLKRSYTEAGWDPRRRDAQAQKKRRQMRTTRLRDARLKFCTTQSFLIPLIPVIDECTSDAESDAEIEGSDMDTGENERITFVTKLPWRHPRIEEAVQLIDQLIERKRKSGSRDFGRSPTYTRFRYGNPRISNRPCPAQLPAHAYCEDWLKTQRIPELTKLHIQTGPSLKGLVKELKKLI
ncbi:uncharacterized protein PGTG_19182 [Puccinia graminis f. sp. tritici CRL 75-36-700-3]|uniref:Uncharacterized protein n=1 Tax=Puccinia graminis f. sp. tritici (strain CRL 75-36-700-3 / race SCCL) TaxID=418459 RepID=E3L9L1_PUCGT|nr:uncharacterized protein PGTG_19182 [Puccinia graminis f. sp. tritici CRL 75-36-700-3]EFP93236.1 hypothetical protein PGTG_19182 [Puccinia graminis f. sp. tritici CRL 75-36-700-3]